MIYIPDLLRCGESDTPRKAYSPIDCAEQLQYFLQTVIKKSLILVAQGALSAVAIELVKLAPNLITGMILSGLTTWNVTTKDSVSPLVYLTIVLD